MQFLSLTNIFVFLALPAFCWQFMPFSFPLNHTSFLVHNFASFFFFLCNVSPPLHIYLSAGILFSLSGMIIG
uniref:Uncharacterized protein n=1 Tax=Rhizophora mucronata TaxID=61149 RepID=A0A2P2LPL3_RHIMU